MVEAVAVVELRADPMSVEHSTTVHPQTAHGNRTVVGTCIANDVMRHGITAVLRRLQAVGIVHHCTHPEEVPSAVIDERYDVIIADRDAAGAVGDRATRRTRILVLVD